MSVQIYTFSGDFFVFLYIFSGEFSREAHTFSGDFWFARCFLLSEFNKIADK